MTATLQTDRKRFPDSLAIPWLKNTAGIVMLVLLFLVFAVYAIAKGIDYYSRPQQVMCILSFGVAIVWLTTAIDGIARVRRP